MIEKVIVHFIVGYHNLAGVHMTHDNPLVIDHGAVGSLSRHIAHHTLQIYEIWSKQLAPWEVVRLMYLPMSVHMVLNMGSNDVRTASSGVHTAGSGVCTASGGVCTATVMVLQLVVVCVQLQYNSITANGGTGACVQLRSAGLCTAIYSIVVCTGRLSSDMCTASSDMHVHMFIVVMHMVAILC